MKTTNHYTFGTSDLAAQRLVLLAQAYEAPTRALLSQRPTATIEHAVDLGCGLGYTTELVHSEARPRHMTGLDASDKLLGEAARRLPSSAITWLKHDITRAPFPCPKADFFFCRFLLTHLHEPTAALRTWAAAARKDAILLVQETARLETADPHLARYYAMVDRLQAAYGQSLHVGEKLEDCFAASGWRIVSARQRTVEQPASVMARLHAMNLRTWSRDAKAVTLFSAEDVACVQAELDRIADGERAAPQVRNVLREIIAQVEAPPSEQMRSPVADLFSHHDVPPSPS